MTLHALVMTLFPEMFPGALGFSLTGKALQEGKWSLETLNIRDYGMGVHHKVDDTPYGGGAGMVMRADVLEVAIEAAQTKQPNARLIYFSPRGVPLTQKLAVELSQQNLILLCGRFEAIDERIIDYYQPLEVSLGDFVMTGGELAAMALLDACVRLLPGVVGEADSLMEESFGLAEDYACLLEHPHYTKPPVWKGLPVPDALLSGHHAKIREWRLKQAEMVTQSRRPDLWERYRLRAAGKTKRG